MPRQDIFDNRSLRNLRGIDLRKNADSNSAEDMVNVWINPENLFTNRPMPSLYKAGGTTFSDAYKFACECKNLAGSEVEIDITSAEAKPSVSASQESTDESGEIWLTGRNLETVRQILWLDTENGGCLVSGVDFTFYYDRENDRIAIVLKDDFDYSLYDYFVLISPYGMVSTQYLGQVIDYYFGAYGEYKIRAYVDANSKSPKLSFEAKTAEGGYKQMQVFGDNDVKVEGNAKHHAVKGVANIWFNNHYGCIKLDGTDPDNPALKVQYYNGAMTDAFTIEGGQQVGEALSSTHDETIDGNLLLGNDDAFQMVGAYGSLTIQIKTDDNTYTTLASF